MEFKNILDAGAMGLALLYLSKIDICHVLIMGRVDELRSAPHMSSPHHGQNQFPAQANRNCVCVQRRPLRANQYIINSASLLLAIGLQVPFLTMTQLSSNQVIWYQCNKLGTAKITLCTSIAFDFLVGLCYLLLLYYKFVWYKKEGPFMS